MSGRRGSSRGMTLIEVLVTLLVLSILLSMVGAILVSALETQKKVGATLFRERVGSAVLDLISRDLGQVYAYDLSESFKGEDARGSSGDADRFEFVTLSERAAKDEGEAEDAEQRRQQQQQQMQQQGQQDPALLPMREPLRLTKVSYFCKDSRSHPGLMTLFRSEQDFTPPPAGTTTTGRPMATTPQVGVAEAKTSTFEVFDRVKRFSVRFLEKDPQQPQSMNWRDAWSDPQKVPAAIEVLLEIVPDPRADAEAQAMGIADRTRKIYPAIISVETTIPQPAQQTQQTTRPTPR